MFKDVIYVDKNYMVKVFDGFVVVRYSALKFRRTLDQGTCREECIAS